MQSRKQVLLPSAAKIMAGLGTNMRLARKRRRFTEQVVADRAGIARSTFQLIEKGDGGVSMSAYLQVLFVLGQEQDVLQVAAADTLGRKLQDAALLR